MKKNMFQQTRVLFTTGVSMVMCASMAFGAYGMPAGTVGPGTTPSIEVEINHLNQVTAVKAVNQEAKELLKDYKFASQDVETVVEDLVNRLILDGYMETAKENKILVSSNDAQVPSETIRKVNSSIQSYIEACHGELDVFHQKIADKTHLTEEANKYHISTGKMAVIKELEMLGGSLTTEAYSKMSVRGLLDYAAENKIDLKNLMERFDDTWDQIVPAEGQKSADDILDDILDDKDDKNDIKEEKEEKEKDAREEKEDKEKDAREEKEDKEKEAREEKEDKEKEAREAREDEAEELKEAREDEAEELKEAREDEAEEVREAQENQDDQNDAED
ncbi:MAG: hypothetical protein RSF83_02795 [Hungatella sp.]